MANRMALLVCALAAVAACGPGDSAGGDAADLPADGCAPGRTWCGASCVDLLSDPDNCGGCRVACNPLHAAAECRAGLCVLIRCEAGFLDGNGDPADGCEQSCIPGRGESAGARNCGDRLDNDCDGLSDAADPDCGGCAPERCDGEDDDCDGLTDEDFDLDFDTANCGRCGNACAAAVHAAPTCILGECSFACDPGWSDLNGDLADGCEATCVPTEIPDESACDGVDDDCNGLTDEDWTSTERCGAGPCERGAVCREGAVVCRPGSPPALIDATCDGVDDDCDGGTDDDLECAPGAAGECTTACRTAGTRACGDGCTWGVCEGPAESCNGDDDDCDGMCDGGWECCLAETGACTTGGAPGVRTCGAGCIWSACEPTGEACNGRDDDGDTTCDEDFTCCRGNVAAQGCGDCGTREHSCADDCTWGPWGGCAGEGPCSPSAAEARACTCGGTESRTCGASCTWGSWSGCPSGACTPASTRSCTASCGSTGTQTCTGTCTWGSCTPPVETCNGADDDCDGGCDNGFTCCADTWGSCTTSCGSTGSAFCSPLCTRGSCTPPVETCNGVDDDCDTQIDDGVSCTDMWGNPICPSGYGRIVAGCLTGWCRRCQCSAALTWTSCGACASPCIEP